MPPKSKKPKGKAESDSDSSDNESAVSTEKIDIDFEAYDMIESDLNGIRSLLHQLFLKANVNITELAQLIISQSNIGCIFKPSCTDEGETNEDQMEVDDAEMDIFGVVSVLNLSQSENQSVKDLRDHFQSQLKLCGDGDIKRQLTTVIGPNSQSTFGFIVNERLINVPCHIAVPSFDSLMKDIKSANEAGRKFNFDYFLFLLKLHKQDSSVKSSQSGGKRKKKSPATTPLEPIVFANPEEEYLMDFTQLWFDFEVGDETDSGLTGQWGSDDSAYKPCRRLVVLPADRMENFVARLKADLSQPTMQS